MKGLKTRMRRTSIRRGADGALNEDNIGHEKIVFDTVNKLDK